MRYSRLFTPITLNKSCCATASSARRTPKSSPTNTACPASATCATTRKRPRAAWGHLRRLQHRFARQPARLVALGQPFHRPRHRTAGPPGRGHAPPRRAHHDPGDPHGPALVPAWRTLAAPGQPVRRARARAPGQRQDHRARNPPHHRRLRGGGAPRAGGRHGRHRDIRRPPAPDRPVLEPAHQLPHRRVRRLSGEPPALRHAGAAGGARAVGRISAWACACAATNSTRTA